LSFVILVRGASGAQENDRGCQTTLDVDVRNQRHQPLQTGFCDSPAKIERQRNTRWLGATPSWNLPRRLQQRSEPRRGEPVELEMPDRRGSLAQVTNPTYAADAFLVGHTVTAAQYAPASAAGSEPAGPVGYHIPGLANVPAGPGWMSSTPPTTCSARLSRTLWPTTPRWHARLVATFAAAAGTGAHHIPVTTEGVGHCVDAVPGRCPPSDSGRGVRTQARHGVGTALRKRSVSEDQDVMRARCARSSRTGTALTLTDAQRR
jgi:hypothetical protein